MAAMYWRILYGSLRIFLGYKLLSYIGMPAAVVFQHFLRRELAETNDFLFQYIGHALVHHGFSITYFLAAYLLFWGVIDVALSISMLRHYLWAFTVSMVLIGGFIFYELFRFSHTHSPILFAFILIDVFIIFLIRHERTRLILRKQKRSEKERNNSGDSGKSHGGNGDPADGA